MPNSKKRFDRIHLRRAQVIDPRSGAHEEMDIVIGDGIIERMGKGLYSPADAIAIDAHSWLVTPGFIDLHAHLREPGEEYKEDIASASASAASGGFTSVCAMPNTKPTNDTKAVTDLILAKAKAVGGIRVYPIGAISKGLKGEELTEIGELKEAGVVALSDDGKPVMNGLLMRRALEYGRTFNLPVVQHAEDLHLSNGGVMHEGECSMRLGLFGQPEQAESVMIARDLELAALTGARYHVAHISTRSGVQMVREAKRRGLNVTCEVTPHHLTLTDRACMHYDTSTKVNPPLRTQSDIDALKEALSDGTIDVIATDHAPHSSIEKEVEFDCAAFGMVGFETALPLILRLVDEGVLTLAEAITKLTWAPARLFNLPGGYLQEGGIADIACTDLGKHWIVDKTSLKSKSKNSPFLGWEMKGQVPLTLVAGRVVHDGLSLFAEHEGI